MKIFNYLLSGQKAFIANKVTHFSSCPKTTGPICHSFFLLAWGLDCEPGHQQSPINGTRVFAHSLSLSPATVLCHVICLDQSQASIQVTWSLSGNCFVSRVFTWSYPVLVSWRKWEHVNIVNNKHRRESRAWETVSGGVTWASHRLMMIGFMVLHMYKYNESQWSIIYSISKKDNTDEVCSL